MYGKPRTTALFGKRGITKRLIHQIHFALVIIYVFPATAESRVLGYR
jgi:hypothetical protein